MLKVVLERINAVFLVILLSSHLPYGIDTTFKGSLQQTDLRMRYHNMNQEFVDEYNNRTNDGIKLKLNSYSNLHFMEFRKLLNSFPNNYSIERPAKNFSSIVDLQTMSGENQTYLNWETRQIATERKSQLLCGASPIFAIISGIESQLQRVLGKRVIFSVQQVIDCMPSDMDPCRGTNFENPLSYIERVGLMHESDYRYTGERGACKMTGLGSTINLNLFYQVAYGLNEEILKDIVTFLGPVPVSVDASRRSFLYYSDGIYKEKCELNEPNHSVLVVGFGREGNDDYWILSNSWGKEWGQNGYMKFIRNKELCCFACHAAVLIVNKFNDN